MIQLPPSSFGTARRASEAQTKQNMLDYAKWKIPDEVHLEHQESDTSDKASKSTVNDKKPIDNSTNTTTDTELVFQSALNTLSCFISPDCFPRYKCQRGRPRKLQRRKKWEEMAFCIDDLRFRNNLTIAAKGDHDDRCLVYSFGIDSNPEWEKKMARLFHCEVHAFDPTAKHKDTQFVKFHQWGIQEEGTDMTVNAVEYGEIDPTRLFTLSEIMKRLGHEGRIIDVLMLDCEGCEWGVLNQLACRGDGVFVNQLLVEVHFQKSLGLASDHDVLTAANAVDCLRRDGWGMTTHERSGGDPKNAILTRGVMEILPVPFFLMYTSLQRLPPESTKSMTSHYEDWLEDPRGKTWREQLTTIRRQGQVIGREPNTKYEDYPRFDKERASKGRGVKVQSTSKSISELKGSEKEILISKLKPPHSSNQNVNK